MYTINDLNNISDMVGEVLLMDNFPNNWRELQIIIDLNKILLLIEFYDKNLMEYGVNKMDLKIQSLLMNCELEYTQEV